MRRSRHLLALIAGLALALLAVPTAAARTRTFWIAAVPATWDVAPNGHDAIEGETVDPERRRLTTIAYRAYTRGWAKPVRRRAPHEQGILGPLLRVRVGDDVVVHFRNADTHFRRPHSMHFHGLHYRVGSDGAYVPGFSGPGGNVRPGRTFTYRLRAGGDSRAVWSYHDHSPSMGPFIEAGSTGRCRWPGAASAGPTASSPCSSVPWAGSTRSTGGRAFVGNTPVFHARVGEVVQWNVLTLGDEFHTFHVHGHRWRRPEGTPEDTRVLGPAESFAVRWREDRAGTWLYHCHVEGHMAGGMIGLYRVRR